MPKAQPTEIPIRLYQAKTAGDSYGIHMYIRKANTRLPWPYSELSECHAGIGVVLGESGPHAVVLELTPKRRTGAAISASFEEVAGMIRWVAWGVLSTVKAPSVNSKYIYLPTHIARLFKTPTKNHAITATLHHIGEPHRYLLVVPLTER